jgi:hypothetical protein
MKPMRVEPPQFIREMGGREGAKARILKQERENKTLKFERGHVSFPRRQ